MDYTRSNSFATHVGTGHRLHTDTAPVPTMWSAADANSVIWSLMAVQEAGGQPFADFDPAVPATYRALLLAIQALAASAAAETPSVPTGMVLPFAGVGAPAGWLECDGSSQLRSAYPALYAVIADIYGAVDGAHFSVPDLRGRVARGWDHGAGRDPGRAFGSAQDDALQNITGAFQSIDGGGNSASGAFAADGALINTINAGIQGPHDSWTFDASRVVRTADETRVKSLAMLMCIKT